MGYAIAADGLLHAVRFGPGGMTDLGAFGGGNSMAVFVNEAGLVVGEASPAGEKHVVVWNGAETIDLGPGEPRGLNGSGFAIGDYLDSGTGRWGCWIWDRGGGWRDLGTLGGHCFSRAINAAGQVVGASNSSSWIWESASGMQPLPYPVGATDVNDAGWVTGGAYVWDPQNGVRSIVVPGANCSSSSINSHGEVAGACDFPDGTSKAFYWSDATGVVVLEPLRRGRLVRVLEINDRAEILGECTDRNGRLRTVLWAR